MRNFNRFAAGVGLAAGAIIGPGAGGEYLPFPEASVAHAFDDNKVQPGEKLCFSVEGNPGDVAVVNLTPVRAEGPGYGLLHSSDVGASLASNVNYKPGTVDPNVAMAPIGVDGKVCYTNSNTGGMNRVDLVADHLGTIAGSVFTFAQPNGEPLRRVDT
ncbi:hypothetical protein KC959_02060, partial [Candidatus Saccharibacteria bacterium]|nr:hypothetical protein [Candidatus Saccharibacteria bacterium]